MEPDTEATYADYVRQSWPSLVRAAVFLGARPHEAEDLAQTTLVRCYTGWGRVSSAENRDAYVYRMLLNCLRDVRRTRWWKDRQHDVALDGPRTAEPDATDRVAEIGRAHV